MAAQTACDAAALFSPKKGKITIPFLLTVLRRALSATASHGDCVLMGEQHLLATPCIRRHIFVLKGLVYAALLRCCYQFVYRPFSSPGCTSSSLPVRSPCCYFGSCISDTWPHAVCARGLGGQRRACLWGTSLCCLLVTASLKVTPGL